MMTAGGWYKNLVTNAPANLTVGSAGGTDSAGALPRAPVSAAAAATAGGSLFADGRIGDEEERASFDFAEDAV